MRKDLTGMQFGRLVVMYENGRSKDGRAVWHCKCSCGANNELDVKSKYLLNGETQSCGCIQREILFKRNFKHGMAKTRFYKIWQNMISRCYNSNIPSYEYYGGRGITVCERWHKFENFKEDMYEPYLKHVEEFGEKDTSIDRIDVNGNYEPNNCRWATMSEQARNTRCIRLCYNGETHTVLEWSEILGIHIDVIFNRILKGRSIDDILYVGNLRYKKYNITYNGETHTLIEWAKITGLSRRLIQSRIDKGFPLDKVFYLGDLRGAKNP